MSPSALTTTTTTDLGQPKRLGTVWGGLVIRPSSPWPCCIQMGRLGSQSTSLLSPHTMLGLPSAEQSRGVLHR